jgi:hypothetical protein
VEQPGFFHISLKLQLLGDYSQRGMAVMFSTTQTTNECINV